MYNVTYSIDKKDGGRKRTEILKIQKHTYKEAVEFINSCKENGEGYNFYIRSAELDEEEIGGNRKW